MMSALNFRQFIKEEMNSNIFNTIGKGEGHNESILIVDIYPKVKVKS